MEAFSVQGRDYLVWRSRRTHVSGAYMPQRQPEPVYRDSGMAEVDLFRGTLIPVSEEMPDRSLKIQVNPEGGYHVDGVGVIAPLCIHLVLEGTVRHVLVCGDQRPSD